MEFVEHGIRVLLTAPWRMRRSVMHIQRERRIRANLPIQELQRVVRYDIRNILVGLVAFAIHNHRRFVVLAATRRMHIPVREARALQSRMPNMPLAAQPAFVAVPRKKLDVGRLPRDVVNLQAVAGQKGSVARAKEVLNAVLRGYAPCQDGSTRGRAHGRSAEEVVESNTRRRKPIEIGRDHLLVARASHRPSPRMVVAQYKQDVRSCGILACHKNRSSDLISEYSPRHLPETPVSSDR